MDGSGGPPTPPPPPPLASDADPPTRPVRAIRQLFQAAGLILGQPSMQRLPRHPHGGGHLLNGSSITNHREHCAIPLLGHTHLPHTGVSRINRAVNHQPKPCKASAEGEKSSLSRRHTPDKEPPRGIEPRTYALRERSPGY